MRSRFLVWFMAIALIASMVLPAPVCGADAALISRVTTVRNLLHYYVNDLSPSDKDKFSKEIDNLQSLIGPLDEQQSHLALQKGKVASAEQDYNAAKGRSASLRRDYETAAEAGQLKLQAVVQEASTVCSQMNGSMNGNTCTIQCKEGAPCPQFPAESFNSQIRAIASEVQAKEQQADAAEKAASAKKQEWNDSKSQLETTQTDFDNKNGEFEGRATEIENEINSAPKHSIAPKLGKAFGQAITASREVDCYDEGCGVSLVAPKIEVPPVMADNPKYQEAVKARDQAVQHAEEARKAFKDYVTSGGNDPQKLTQLWKKDSEAQTIKLNVEWGLANITNLLKPVPPKPAEQNRAK